MSLEQLTVSRGPDKWNLAESIFHDTYEDAPVFVYFTVDYAGRNMSLTLNVLSIARIENENGTYRISGIGKIYDPSTKNKIAEHAPVEVSFSVRTRTGIAQIKF